jgi:hypothetical protein
VIHVLLWVWAAIGSRYAYCTDKSFYPLPFVINLAISTVLFVFVHLKMKQGFKLTWAKEEETAKKLFEAQIDRYYKSTRFVLFLHFVEVAIGKLIGKFSDDLACCDDGCEWVYLSSKGNIFIALHIIGAMIASGVARAVLIKTVSAVGIFAELDEESDSESEDERAAAELKKDQ